MSALPEGIRKVFVLNEGGMGSNNATLDFLRRADRQYITGAFRKMNPDAGAGLGDVGNDIAMHGDEVWMVINNSGIVEVVSAIDECEIAAIPVPTPRNIAFDAKYAYVTSWAGAFAAGAYDSEGNYTITDSANPKGAVYRIDLEIKQVVGSVEVGYQPEGIACANGRLYAANSGGISSQLPPLYSYDNTLSIIDTQSFKVEKTLTVQENLKNVYAASDGLIYVTCLGNYWSIPSGLYIVNKDEVSAVAEHVSVSALLDNTVYYLGTDSEFDWTAAHVYTGGKVQGGSPSPMDWTVTGMTPYGLCALSDGLFLLGDAGDYFNPGSVKLFNQGKEVWSVQAGVCPGHFAIW